MEAIDTLKKYLDDTVNLDRLEIQKLLSVLDVDLDEINEQNETSMRIIKGKLYDAERELRIIRKVVNLYFKQESENLQCDLPF